MTIRKYLTASCLYTSVCFCRSQPEGIKYCEDFERRGVLPTQIQMAHYTMMITGCYSTLSAID